MEQVKLLSSTSLAHTDAINSSIQTQQHLHDQTVQHLQQANINIANITDDSRRDHAELLQSSRQMGTDVTEFRAVSSQGHASTPSAIHEHVKRTSDRFDVVANRDALLLERMNGTYDNLYDYRTETHQRLDDAHRILNDLTANLADIRTTTVFSAYGIEMITQDFRKEMRSALEPIFEQAFTRSENHNEILLNRMQALIQIMATDVGRGLHKPGSHETERDSMATSHLAGSIVDARKRSHLDLLINDTQCRYMKSTFSRTWLFKWKVGSLRIEIHTTRRRVSDSPAGSIHTKLHIWFRPSQSLIQLPGLAMTYETGPGQRGYYHIAPAICVVPIFSWDHPIFVTVRYGDLLQVKSLLATGQGNVRMQTKYGSTLLHVSLNLIWGSDLKIVRHFGTY